MQNKKTNHISFMIGFVGQSDRFEGNLESSADTDDKHGQGSSRKRPFEESFKPSTRRSLHAHPAALPTTSPHAAGADATAVRAEGDTSVVGHASDSAKQHQSTSLSPAALARRQSLKKANKDRLTSLGKVHEANSLSASDSNASDKHTPTPAAGTSQANTAKATLPNRGSAAAKATLPNRGSAVQVREFLAMYKCDLLSLCYRGSRHHAVHMETVFYLDLIDCCWCLDCTGALTYIGHITGPAGLAKGLHQSQSTNGEYGQEAFQAQTRFPARRCRDGDS